MHDVIIVGGGPAGLAAALSLGRSRRTTLLLDGGEGRNAASPEVHNVLTHDGVSPAELRRIGREQLAAYPTVEVRDVGVTDVAATALDGTFELRLADGDSVAVTGGIIDQDLLSADLGLPDPTSATGAAAPATQDEEGA